MMGPFITAWLTGLGIFTYRHQKEINRERSTTQDPKTGKVGLPNVFVPPGPGTLVAASGAFVLLALLAEIPAAQRVSIMIAWGVDVAAFASIFAGKPWNGGGQGGAWPPPFAPNNVVIPNGSTVATAAQTSGSTNPPTTLV
jgi:hypothetical protein